MLGTRRWMWLLLCSVLTACAATPPAVSKDGEGLEQVASWEEACEAQGSLLALCDAEQCGLYRCRDVAEHLTVGRVVPTLSTGTTLPGPGGAAQRYWGSRQRFPWRSQPVLVIPWGPRPPPLQPSQKLLLSGLEVDRNRPYEMHHLFPQEKGLKEWFALKGIAIHQYTMPLDIKEHRRIHRGAQGGPWNEAWRKYRDDHFGASKQEIFLQAVQLIYEFRLYGIVVPYRHQSVQAPPADES